MTDTARTLAALQAALDANPLDTTARLVLADLLEDQGDEEAAACMRWMAREGRRALPPKTLSSKDHGWGWRMDRDPIGLGRHPDTIAQIRRAVLPKNVVMALPHTALRYTPWWFFPTRQAAEDALLAAWRSLPADQRPT